MGTLKQDLLDRGFELRQTHISLVFLGESVVFKVKKPVDLGFLDFTQLEQRRRYCQAEVELNRRLAPGVYRGVVPIVRDRSGVHQLGAPGEPVEYAVEMRRLPERDAADARLQEGRLGRAELTRIAERLARFHADARCDAETTRFGEVELIEANVRENFAQTRSSARAFLSAEELQAIEAFQLGFLRQHAQRFAERRAQLRIRDGHGDLRLEHCYLDDAGGLEIIDCIEFNERFRYGDVAADLAFLAMDLAWHGRTDLAELLLAEYAAASADYGLYGVIDFYESYRAFVRGKISAIVADDESLPSGPRERARQQARKYFVLAHACAREPLEPPVLYAVGGLIASGKSTLAGELAARCAAPRLEADRTRKQLAEVAATTPLHDAAFAGHYAPQVTDQVYAELLRRADTVLASKRSVVIDASFRDRSKRAAALELARRHGARFVFVECRAPEAVLRKRLEQRALRPSVSDGRAEVFDAFMARYEPVTELPADQHLTLDTTGPVAQTVEQLARTLQLPPQNAG